MAYGISLRASCVALACLMSCTDRPAGSNDDDDAEMPDQQVDAGTVDITDAGQALPDAAQDAPDAAQEERDAGPPDAAMGCAWSDLVELNRLSGASAPSLATGPGGIAVAAWTYESLSFEAWSARFDGTTWGMGVEVSGFSSDSAVDPQVAVDGAGNVFVVWSKEDSISTEVWVNRFDATAGTWDTAFELTSLSSDAPPTPRVAVDAQGNATVVWNHGSLGHEVWARRYDASTQQWGMTTEISTFGSDDPTGPELVVDGNGAATVVYERHTSGFDHEVWSTRLEAGSTAWSMPVEVTSFGSESATTPRLAVDGQGRVIVVYNRESLSDHEVWSSRYAGNTWSMPVEVSTFNSDSKSTPVIAMDDAGNAIAAWNRETLGDHEVWSARFDVVTGTWGMPAERTSFNSDSATMPDIAMHRTTGAAAIAYDRTSLGDHEVWSTQFDPMSNTWSQPAERSVFDSDTVTRPRVRIAGDGTVHLVWQKKSSSFEHVVSRHCR